MATNVLILASRYDSCSFHTFEWARLLQRELFRYADNCLLFEVTGLCRSGTVLADLVQTATHVIFYGHGEQNQWIALPGTAPTALVDAGTISVLDKRDVYAGCCWSLSGLGQAFAATCTGNYIGYAHQFGFEAENEDKFRDVVNQSAMNFVTSGNPSKVVSDLRQEWTKLSNDFTLGVLKSRPNAVQAGHLADLNSQRIGIKP